MADSTNQDQLAELVDHLKSGLETDASSALDTLHELEATVRGQHSKTAAANEEIVSTLALRASADEHPLEQLLHYLKNLKTAVKQPSVIRGILLACKDRGTEAETLFYGYLARCLEPEKESEGEETASASFAPSSTLLNKMRTTLKEEKFSRLGVEVWDATLSEERSLEWCGAWGDFSEEILTLFLKTRRPPSKKKKVSVMMPDPLQGLATEYAQRLADADGQGADSLIPFFKFLFSEVGPCDEATLVRLECSPLGTALQALASLLSGGAGSPQAGMEGGTGLQRRAAAKGPVPSTSTILPDGLPGDIKMSIRRLCLDLETSLAKGKEELQGELKKKDDALAGRQSTINSCEGEIDKLNRGLSAIEEELEKLQGKLAETRTALADEEAQRAAVEESLEAAEKSLELAREDYEIQGSRSEQNLEKRERDILVGLESEIGPFCEKVKRMIEAVIERPEDADLLKEVWNQFNDVLLKEIGGEDRKGYEI